MTGLYLRMAGDAPITRRYRAIEHATEDMTPVWGQLRERFIAMNMRSFAREASAKGKWAKLTDAYAAAKARKYPGKTILRRTDDLYRSLTDRLDINIIEPHRMVLGSDVSYGKAADKRRPILGFTTYERRIWVGLVRDHIMATGEMAEVA